MRVVLLGLLFITLQLQAQQQINVYKNYTSILIFKSDIVNIINGNDIDYIIEKDANKFSNNRTLTIKQLPESRIQSGTNVIVFTKDGNIYHFDLIYKKPQQLIHHIDPEKAHSSLPESNIVENSAPIENQSTPVNRKTSTSVPAETDEKMDKVIAMCEKTEGRKKRIFQNLVKSYNVYLSLKDIAYSGDELYLYFELRNKGGQAYDIEYMHFFKSTSETENNITSQKDRLDVYYIHNDPDRISGKSKHEFIAVIQKTSINENKTIAVRIKEKGGERDLNLNINDQIINNPVKL